MKKTITREDLGKKVNLNLGFSKIISKNLINDIFEILTLAFKNSSFVKITTFGTFKTINKKERIGRNPKTKKVAKISSRKVVVFKASNLFKNKLNNNNNDG